MPTQDLIKEAEEKMKKAVEATRHEFTQVRTGRANPAMVEHITVTYYGSDMHLRDLATITVPEPRQLLITPFDRAAIGALEKAILKSDLNLTPNNDGTAIRLSIPPLTEERRKEFIKILHKKAEVGHASIRTVRQDCNNHLKGLVKSKECGEDDEKRAVEKVQKLTDQYIAEIDRATKAKEVELMEV
jgi:ribosome recycling factor